MKHVARLASLLALFALSSPMAVLARAQPEWTAALCDGGGHVIVLRHGATYPDQADTESIQVGQCRQAARTQ